MEDLFDLDKPYFAAWVQLHDVDTYSDSLSTFHHFTPYSKSGAVPLYYAALCGFQDLVEHLILKYPQHVNARGGYYVTPLVAALAREHYQTAKILRDNGAHPNVTGHDARTPLHAAVYSGHLQMVQVLLEYKADISAKTSATGTGITPLHYMVYGNYGLSRADNLACVLLKHGADVNARSNDQSTPLHLAAQFGMVCLVHVLLDHGASVGAEDERGRTPLQMASLNGHSSVVKLLSEHGAK
jgi:ankyrin repeat protein